MLDPDILSHAIEIQQKSYRLLRWVAEAIDDGLIPAHCATRHAEGSDAVVEWVRRYHNLFPGDVQVDSKDVDTLARFFWTYVVTSFDVVAERGSRGAFGTTGCTCELCVRLVDASHLKTKKLTAFDKRRAATLMTARAVTLGAEHGIVIEEPTATSYLNDPALRRAMAYSAYGESLLERLEGATDGPAILALWREIAWKAFHLDVADFAASEQQVLDHARSA